MWKEKQADVKLNIHVLFGSKCTEQQKRVDLKIDFYWSKLESTTFWTKLGIRDVNVGVVRYQM
jgi:hypothetical protein